MRKRLRPDTVRGTKHTSSELADPGHGTGCMRRSAYDAVAAASSRALIVPFISTLQAIWTWGCLEKESMTGAEAIVNGKDLYTGGRHETNSSNYSHCEQLETLDLSQSPRVGIRWWLLRRVGHANFPCITLGRRESVSSAHPSSRTWSAGRPQDTGRGSQGRGPAIPSNHRLRASSSRRTAADPRISAGPSFATGVRAIPPSGLQLNTCTARNG